MTEGASHGTCVCLLNTDEIRLKKVTTPKIIGFVRFSVLYEKTNCFAIGEKSGSFEQYRSALFDSDRLNGKFDLFETFTIPSIMGQSITPDKEWFRLCVITSTYLPAEYKARLENLCDNCDWLVVREVDAREGSLHRCAIEEIECFCDVGDLYASFRLDDDDSLGVHYIEDLLNYTKKELCGFGVTFAKGYTGYYDLSNARLSSVSNTYYPKIGLGLALISIRRMDVAYSAFDFGNHKRADERFPIILTADRPSYLRVLSYHGDQLFGQSSDGIMRRKEAWYVDDADLELFRSIISIDYCKVTVVEPEVPPSVNLKFTVMGSQVNVEVMPVGLPQGSYEYACYWFRDNHVVLKSKYQTSNLFVFDIGEDKRNEFVGFVRFGEHKLVSKRTQVVANANSADA